MTDALCLFAADPIAHVVDSPLVGWYISNATVMMVLAALITSALVIPAARRIETGRDRSLDDFRAEGTLANLVETVCLYLRNDVFRPVLHEETDRFTPMLWTLFWFILVCNLLGLVPLLDLTAMLGLGHHGHGIGGTATQSIWVTGALALVAAGFYIGSALREDPVGFLKHLTGGAPWYMWVIMVPVEIIGHVVKPCALAIRLFANMTGGHLLVAVLLSFVPAAIEHLGFLGGGGVSLVAMLGAVAINALEILVSFIQAYIFTFLTCLFLGQLVVHHHDGHEEEGHGEAHGHGSGDHGTDEEEAGRAAVAT